MCNILKYSTTHPFATGNTLLCGYYMHNMHVVFEYIECISLRFSKNSEANTSEFQSLCRSETLHPHSAINTGP